MYKVFLCPCRKSIGYIRYDIEYLGSEYELFRLASPGYFTYDSNATGDQMYYVIGGGIDVVLGTDGKYYEDLGVDANGNQKYVDRYGVISLIHRGKFDDTESVEAIFEFYTSDEYRQTIVKDIDDIIQQK